MTILPTLRKSTTSSEENTETSQQNATTDRSNRRNEMSPLTDTSTSSRTTFPYNKDRKERLRKRRDREREQKREHRREQFQNRVNTSREVITEPLIDNSPVNEETVAEPTNNNKAIIKAEVKEEATGFNSEDEYDYSCVKDRVLTDEEWQKRDDLFSRYVSSLGWEIKQMNEDGACLFRSIADQVFGDQELHFQVRQDCMNYIVKNRDYFEPYVTEDFDKYISRKRTWYVHGNHLEIQAMSELYNRSIEVYCYQIEPINIFNGPKRLVNSYEPIRLSYHRMCHYNSISNPNKPSVGVGLGLPNYHPVDIDRSRLHDAVRASEQLLIEQTMLEDKLNATDWEATNDDIAEQVARESYIQYFRESEKRLTNQGQPLASGSSSTITSAMVSSPRTSRRGSVSPKGGQSPKASSPHASPRNAFGGNSETEHVVPTLTKVEDSFGKIYSPRRLTANDIPQEDLVPFPISKTAISKSPKHDEAGPSSSWPSFNEDHFGQSDMPPNSFDDSLEEDVLMHVLAESQQTYLEELKKKGKQRNGSPGPSTSR